MPLLLVFLQNSLHGRKQRSVYKAQFNRHIFVNRTFADSKTAGRFPNGRAMFYNVLSENFRSASLFFKIMHFVARSLLKFRHLSDIIESEIITTSYAKILKGRTVKMNSEKEAAASFCVMEGMTSVSSLLAATAQNINDRKIHEILFDKEMKDKKRRIFTFLLSECKKREIPLRLCLRSEIDSVSTGNTHGGVAAICGDRSLLPLSDENFPHDAFLCYLDGIEDPYNFGYTIRSLYAAGCNGILLSERNWMSAAGVVARASAGTSEAIPMYGAGNGVNALSLLKSAGYRVITAGIRNSVPYMTATLKKPLVLVVGGEKRGISAAVNALSDQVVRIPYGRDFCGSLPTASASAVIGFEILRQNS